MTGEQRITNDEQLKKKHICALEPVKTRLQQKAVKSGSSSGLRGTA